MTILSSRENTCINPQVAVYPNKNEACADLLDVSLCSLMTTTSCHYHNDDGTKIHTAQSQVVMLEHHHSNGDINHC